MPKTELVKLSVARRAVAEAKSVDELKDIRNRAEAIRYAAIQAGMGLDIINDAAEIKLRAERKAGGLLGEMGKAKGTRGQLAGGSRLRPLETEPTLSELGVSKSESSRWQAIATVPQEMFEQQIENIKVASERLTTAGMVRLAHTIQTSRQSPVLGVDVKVIHGDMLKQTIGEFDLVIADPPYNVTNWDWDKIGTPKEFIEQSRKWLEKTKTFLASEYHLFWFCSPRLATDIELLFRGLDLPIKSRIVWHRRNMAMGSDAKNRFIDSWEMVFHSGNKSLNFPSNWTDARFDVQIFAVPQTNFSDKKLHPTQKPAELVRRLVEFGSRPGDRILDPFAGSGTTGRESAGRKCTLIEKDDEYAKLLRVQFE